MNEIQSAPQGTLLIKRIADRYHVDPNKMIATLKATAFKQSGDREVTNEQMMALLVVADQYKLNPFTRQIYAFAQGGGIVPIVPIDGWMAIVNSNPQFNGMKFDDEFDDAGNIVSVTCKMFRKDREHSIEVTEYLAECQKNTEPWKKWPVRMLRHKATIQCARYAFGLSGIFDDDEANRIAEVNSVPDHVPRETPADFDESIVETMPVMDDQAFADNLDVAQKLISTKKKTASEIIDMLSAKYSLTADQALEIEALEVTNENA